ncbi:MAG: hypothetical protein JSV21_02130, partial [Nitrospirota bacterium]
MKLNNLNIILISFIVLIFSNNSYSAIYCSAPAADSDCSDSICDLQSALADAEASSEDDEINLEQGTYNVPSGVHFTYISSDSGSLIVSGGWNSSCLSQTGDSGTTELVGISPAAATDTFGGVLDISINNASASDLEISNLTVRNGTAIDDGGGINIDHFTGGRLNINLNNLQVLNNVAGQEGGGIEIFDWVTNGGINVNISECLISGNDANTSGPGGIDIIADTTNVADPSTIGITLAGNTILNNTADSYGGAMYIDPDGSDAIIYNNVIAGNSVTGVSFADGGGINFSPFSGGNAIITNNT